MAATRAFTAMIAAGATVLAAGAVAQPPDAGALGASPQARTAAPAPAVSVKAGEGGRPAPSAGPQTLDEAFAACDMGAVLRLGGGQARDAMRVVIGKGQMSRDVDPESGVWTRTRTGFALSHLEDGERYDVTANPTQDPFDGWAPPNIAALPDADAIGPAPRGGVPASQWKARRELYENATSGMSAPDTARAYFTAMGITNAGPNYYHLSQAYYARCTVFPSTPMAAPALCLRTPAWGPRGADVRSVAPMVDGTDILDPHAFPGYDQLPEANDPRPDLTIPPEVERRRALPPPPPPPPGPRQPPRNC